MTAQRISQKRLKELFNYNPDTGVFVWKQRRAGNATKGSVAGSTDKRGYIRMCIDYKYSTAHRLAWLYMTGSFPENEIDHIDQDKGNNSFSNLREVTRQENAKNIPMSKNNNSGTTGVHWYLNRWVVTIYVKGKRIYGGRHTSLHKAIAIRKALEVMFDYHPNHGT